VTFVPPGAKRDKIRSPGFYEGGASTPPYLEYRPHRLQSIPA
jgi:hypothetical protein